ncbi:hypothetical protein YB2330_005508 [Saitoella coloradoensis]
MTVILPPELVSQILVHLAHTDPLTLLFSARYTSRDFRDYIDRTIIPRLLPQCTFSFEAGYGSVRTDNRVVVEADFHFISYDKAYGRATFGVKEEEVTKYLKDEFTEAVKSGKVHITAAYSLWASDEDVMSLWVEWDSLSLTVDAVDLLRTIMRDTYRINRLHPGSAEREEAIVTSWEHKLDEGLVTGVKDVEKLYQEYDQGAELRRRVRQKRLPARKADENGFQRQEHLRFFKALERYQERLVFMHTKPKAPADA